jgi:hypothetical protein
MADETKKSAKERVKEKFDIAADMKKSKIDASIGNVEKADGKIKANFSISGLPTKSQKGSSLISSDSSYRNFTKIFDDFDDFAAYAKEFLDKSDEDLIAMSKG